MKAFLHKKISPARQLMITVGVVLLSSVACYLLRGVFNYHVAAFILLFAVSVCGMFFDILPVLSGAALSAFIWYFFFIPPAFTLYVEKVEDRVLLLMYLLIALLNAVLTYKTRRQEKIALQKEEKANTVKLYNTLLSSLSHELRTPITAIIGASDHLMNNSSKLSAEHKSELLHEISRASLRLNEQVDNLLDMSRLESGFIQPQKNWVDISELIYDTVRKIEEQETGRQIRVSIHPATPLFRLDYGMLERILFNLLTNACSYTPADTEIAVTATCHADVLVLTVEDEGAGFPPEEIGRVFDKFYRLKNSRPGGTGLGLSIVKGFTESMGGTISLENKDTGGACFILEFPAEASYLKNLKNE